MTTVGECDVSKIVTAFLLNTCRLRPRSSRRDVQAAMLCGTAVCRRPASDNDVRFIPLTSGSVAEFYIGPMLPHVSDIDVMYHRNTQLAIPRGHPPPTQLPAEFHNYVQIFEIIDSHLAGYVYLKSRCLLARCINGGKCEYRTLSTTPDYIYQNEFVENDGRTVHGPASTYYTHNGSSLLSVDTVLSVRCLLWPPQASDWQTRHRNYGWPESATLDLVVSNGCDLVQVAHRQCRQHEWMRKYQRRLSFSRAEIVLINSWMPVQQIAYHILRVYMKAEGLTESVDSSLPAIMSNYHIKTLTLWACELKPRSWWTENLNLVRICAELLNTLSVWLGDTRCPHYFINNCNLLDTSLSDAAVTSKLMSIDETYLSTWLINSYIGRCAQLCPPDFSRLFEAVSTNMKLQHAVSEIVRWRLSTSLYEMWQTVDFAEIFIPAAVLTVSLTARSCVYSMNALTKIDKCFSPYFAAVALLHVARKLSINAFIDNLIGTLGAIVGPNFNQCSDILSRYKTERNISELVEFLHASAVEHLTTYRQLIARDFGSVVMIVTTEYEALYAYKRGDYQRCLQLSTQNVHTLLICARHLCSVTILPEFIPLFDDDIVSLTALTLMVNRMCRYYSKGACITQLTLSLYLMTQCQLKLHHSVSSLAQTLHCIKFAQTRISREHTLNYLTIKLIERKVSLSILDDVPENRYLPF